MGMERNPRMKQETESVDGRVEENANETVNETVNETTGKVKNLKREREKLIGLQVWTMQAWKIRKRTAAGLLLAAVLALTTALGGCSSSDGNNDAANSGNAAKDSGSSDSSANATGDEGTSSSTNNAAAADDGSGTSDKADEPAVDDDGASTSPPAKGESSQYDDSRPGQLTAGEWDDMAAWQDWQQLLSSQEGRENESYWSIYPQHRLEVDVSAGGEPIMDATVELIGSDGETAWEARTNNEGVAYVYAGLFDEQGTQEEYGVLVTSGNQKKQYENVPVPRAKALKVELENEVKGPDALDLMLLVDTTGSMQDELNYLKTELKDVVKRVDRDNGQRLGIRVSANFYRDHADDYVVKAFPFTDDIDKVVSQLSEQKAAGGGDFPEAVDEALASAIDKHEWSGDARARLLFLVMDAPPHHERKVTKRLRELTETAAAEGIRIIPVASSGVDEHTEYIMRFLASATGGTYLFLTDHSGIGNDHLKPEVGEYEVKALNDLLVEVINRYAS
ncbi:vWA domain-containing protein [Paenibacillus sacheonensis]|uniref:VWA domain-containing protein n=1 Tax=Paenibacillus sacheonensis TaxID=742054 RepID=A0A7X5C0C8_9BACL|nr:VWA domain-containing protein [Paenibacillus sacheonensis]MBM7566809.1 hypothetical protein [Paenibacillus sacheonensis]NBC71431.1 VWA domain-containing protein [Paenibacillus sacheonensis]